MSMSSGKTKGGSVSKRVARRQKSMLPLEFAAVAYGEKQSFPGRGASRSRRITNSELIGTVNGSVAFVASSYPINPGMAATFPWLSVQASEWEQYSFHALTFRYVTRTATSTVGSVILSPDYDPTDLTPTTERQASNTEDAVEDVCWKCLECRLNPRAMFPMGPRKLVRSCIVAGDPNVYDAGTFNLCVVEETGSSAIGKLWVDYDVEFFVPQNSPSEALGPTRTSLFGKTAAQTFTSTVAATCDFDVTTYDPLHFGPAAGGVFTPPAGTYHVCGQLVLNDSVSEAFTGNLALIRAGSAVSTTSFLVAATGTTERVTLPFDFVTPLDGTQSFYLSLTLTGAAGTLTSVAGTSVLTIAVA